jgi:hypothetical protein
MKTVHDTLVETEQKLTELLDLIRSVESKYLIDPEWDSVDTEALDYVVSQGNGWVH